MFNFKKFGKKKEDNIEEKKNLVSEALGDLQKELESLRTKKEEIEGKLEGAKIAEGLTKRKEAELRDSLNKLEQEEDSLEDKEEELQTQLEEISKKLEKISKVKEELDEL